MNSRETSDMPPAPSYPSPNAAQIGQGTMQYYSNRQLTEDELLSAELSRDASGPGLPDGSSNGVHHGQSMVLGSSGELGRPSSAHHEEHMLQFTPSQQVGVDPNHDLSYGDQSARRKRSKISRACDECRRKKVRCDASSESGVEACSNCRRLGVTCQFSRVPMKRGPSKGYIKELAERLHTLESQMQPGMVNSDMPYQSMGEASPPRNYQDFPSPVEGGSLNRKRTYSVFEGLPSASFTQPPFSSRGSQNAFDAQGTAPDHSHLQAVHNAPAAGNVFWHPTVEHGLPSGVEVEDIKQTSDEDFTPVDVDDAALNAYRGKVHPFVPILPQSKDRLLELLHQCPREVQEVFLFALYTVTHTNMNRVASAFQKLESFDGAQDLLLFHARNLPMAPLTPLNIVLLQTMLLMILDSDTRGPDNLILKNGVPKHTLLLTAGKLGYDLAKSCGQLNTQRASVPDPDADANVVRRCWVSLVILSRWYAISMADSSLMRSEEILGREDSKILGRGVMAIGSYSTFLNDLVSLIVDNPNVCQNMTGLGRVVGNNMVSAIERLNREDSELASFITQEEIASNPFLESLSNQLFWTVRLLMKRHVFVYSPYEIIHCAEALMDEMHRATMSSRLATPFDLHSLCLATMTLLEATVLPEFANECWEALKKLDAILDYRAERATAPTEFEEIFSTPGWDAKLRLFTEWRRAKVQESQIQDANATLARRNSNAAPPMGPNEQRSLQHLADLAVGAEGSVGNASPPPENPAGPTSPKLAPFQPSGRIAVDFTMLTHKGYLNVFAGLIYSRRLART